MATISKTALEELAKLNGFTYDKRSNEAFGKEKGFVFSVRMYNYTSYVVRFFANATANSGKTIEQWLKSYITYKTPSPVSSYELTPDEAQVIITASGDGVADANEISGCIKDIANVLAKDNFADKCCECGSGNDLSPARDKEGVIRCICKSCAEKINPGYNDVFMPAISATEADENDSADTYNNIDEKTISEFINTNIEAPEIVEDFSLPDKVENDEATTVSAAKRNKEDYASFNASAKSDPGNQRISTFYEEHGMKEDLSVLEKQRRKNATPGYEPVVDDIAPISHKNNTNIDDLYDKKTDYMASLTPPQVEAIIKRNEAEKGPKVEDLHDKSEYASKKKSNVDQSIMNSRDATYVGRDPNAPKRKIERSGFGKSELTNILYGVLGSAIGVGLSSLVFQFFHLLIPVLLACVGFGYLSILGFYLFSAKKDITAYLLSIGVTALGIFFNWYFTEGYDIIGISIVAAIGYIIFAVPDIIRAIKRRF